MPTAAVHVCCIAGSPFFVHYFVMSMFYDRPTADASYIWDHGEIPSHKQEYGPIYCGAKQLWLSRLYGYCTIWMRERVKLNAFTKAAFLELLGVLAASYHFGNASGELGLSNALTLALPFDFTRLAVARLEPCGTGSWACSIRHPLELELAIYMGTMLAERPAARGAWNLLSRLRPRQQQTAATVSEGRICGSAFCVHVHKPTCPTAVAGAHIRTASRHVPGRIKNGTS